MILIMKYHNLLITTLFTLGHMAFCCSSYKRYCVEYKARMLVNLVGKPKLMTSRV